MVCKQVLGTLNDFPGRTVAWIELEWYEAGKRLLHKETGDGQPVVLKLLQEKVQLRHHDVVYATPDAVIAIRIKPCAVMVLRPSNMYAMASLCYEIGNKHLPLFYEDGCLLVPFEAPIYKMLEAAGFAPEQAERQLLKPLRTSVTPHGSGGSLFSKIMQLTSNG